MNSFNHYAFGAIGEWMYENIIGIQPDPDSPGYRHFILKPLPGGSLTWARGSYNSISGKIEAEWKKDGKKFKYDFTIPANTTAKVSIPGNSLENVLLKNKKAADHNGQFNPVYKDGYTIFELPAGTWTAISEL
jgi:alpha-L-rhamnosidase